MNAQKWTVVRKIQILQIRIITHEKVDTLVDKMGMTNYKFDEQFYKEIVKDSKFSYGKFNET